DGVGRVAGLGALVADGAGAAQVEAKLNAVAMEAAAPIDRRVGAELVVLDADPLARKGAVELSPALFHLRPSTVFICDGHKSLIISIWAVRRKSMRGTVPAFRIVR